MKCRLMIAILVICTFIIYSHISAAGPLHEAAVAGDIKKIKKLLATGEDINELGRINNSEFLGTPLHWAVSEEKEEAVEFLIKKGADVNAVGQDCCDKATPLDVAVWQSNAKIVRLLLESRANVEGIAHYRLVWPLRQAILKGDIEIAQILLDHGADINRRGVDDYTILHDAVSSNKLVSLKFLLSKGMDANTPTGPLGSWETALHIAAWHGYIEIATILLEHGANMNLGDDKGDTPLHTAVKKGNKDFIELLLKRGARIDIKNNFGETPLMLAEKQGNQVIINLLLNTRTGK